MTRSPDHEADVIAVREAVRELLGTLRGPERDALARFLGTGPTFGALRRYVDETIRRLEALRRPRLN